MKLLIFILSPLTVIGAVIFLSFDHRDQVKIDQHGLTEIQTILQFAQDEALMQAGKALFVSQCASCHTATGIGGTAPKLTDNKFLLVKEVTDIYSVISNGSIAKGMPPWKGILSNTKLILLSSYVLTLQEKPTEETSD